MTFPTPEQVRAEFEKSIEPIAEVFRQEIRNLFLTPINYNGVYNFDPITVLAEAFGGVPDYATWQAAFDKVKQELTMSGWSAVLRSHLSEYSISIEPMK